MCNIYLFLLYFHSSFFNYHFSFPPPPVFHSVSSFLFLFLFSILGGDRPFNRPRDPTPAPAGVEAPVQRPSSYMDVDAPKVKSGLRVFLSAFLYSFCLAVLTPSSSHSPLSPRRTSPCTTLCVALRRSLVLHGLVRIGVYTRHRIVASYTPAFVTTVEN